MTFDASALIASFLVSSVGFVLLVYGKKMGRIPHLASGLLLLVFPYFLDRASWILLGGAIICGLCWVAVQYGW